MGSLHPRNRHQGRYDLPALVALHPPLRAFLRRTPTGVATVDFADPRAVKALNTALLMSWHGVVGWDFPDGFLCPPIPGRADYLHHLADLLAADHAGVVPRGDQVRVLDVGIGANAIYPLLGHGEYGWRFVGADINPDALESARTILARNPRFAASIELRRQGDPRHAFTGIIRPGERFAATLCNPPFHASAAAAEAGSRRKWRNLGRSPDGRTPGRGRVPDPGDTGVPALNFAGQAAELVCPGGEVAFIDRMIDDSICFARQCRWFTTLVAHGIHLRGLEVHLERVGARSVRTISMAQGQKQSRILAWTFQATQEGCVP